MRRRAVLWSIVIVALAGAFVTVGLSQQYPAFQVRLHSGAVWLASNRVGQLTLLDGSSEEVVARVTVAEPGTALVAAQLGSTGYAVNRRTGTVIRIDGTTLEPSDPVTPLSGAGNELALLPAQGILYLLDTKRGVLAQSDPQTLGVRGDLQPLVGKISEHGLISDDGTLWVLDGDTGDLVRYAQGSQRARKSAGTPGFTQLAVAEGPILVDQERRVAELLDRRTGEIRRSVRLDVRKDEDIAVGGAPGRLLLSIGARGLFVSCSFAAGQCTPVALSSQALSLGPAVESGGRVFIPDYTRGHVFIVDLDTHAIIDSDLFSQQQTFELLVHDGFVFYNNPEGDQAGVITLDGNVRRISKYARAKSDQDGKPIPDQGQRPEPKPERSPNTELPPVPASAHKAPGTTAPLLPDVPEPVLEPEPLILRINPSTVNPMVAEDVILTVDSDTETTLTSAHWDFGDNQTADGASTAHRWTAPGVYQVTVQATVPDGRQATAAVSVEVSPPPHKLKCGDVITASATLGQDLTCAATTGLTIAADDVVLDLGGHTLSVTDPNEVRSALIVTGPETLNGVTVRNGTIQSDGVALSVTDTNNMSIVDVHLKGGEPLLILTTAAIIANRARGLRIMGSRISGYTDNVGGFGFDNQTTVTISGSTFLAAYVLCSGASICTIETSTFEIDRLDCGPSRNASVVIRNNVDPRVFDLGNVRSVCASAAISDNFSMNIFSVFASAVTITGNTRVVDGMTVEGEPTFEISSNNFDFPGIGRVWLQGGRGSITGNTFNGSPYCALYLTFVGSVTGPVSISGNNFSNNGHSSQGGICSPGDGLRIEANIGADITVSNNHTQNNAEYGIHANPGTVIDGGGNTSSGDPQGCLGVICT